MDELGDLELAAGCLRRGYLAAAGAVGRSSPQSLELLVWLRRVETRRGSGLAVTTAVHDACMVSWCVAEQARPIANSCASACCCSRPCHSAVPLPVCALASRSMCTSTTLPKRSRMPSAHRRHQRHQHGRTAVRPKRRSSAGGPGRPRVWEEVRTHWLGVQLVHCRRRLRAAAGRRGSPLRVVEQVRTPTSHTNSCLPERIPMLGSQAARPCSCPRSSGRIWRARR